MPGSLSIPPHSLANNHIGICEVLLTYITGTKSRSSAEGLHLHHLHSDKKVGHVGCADAGTVTFAPVFPADVRRSAIIEHTIVAQGQIIPWIVEFFS